MIQHLIRLSLVLFAAFSLAHSIETAFLFTAAIYLPYLLAIHAKQIEAYINSPRLLLADTWHKLQPIGRFAAIYATLLFVNPSFLGLPLLEIINCFLAVALIPDFDSAIPKFFAWLGKHIPTYKMPNPPIVIPNLAKRFTDAIAYPIGIACAVLMLTAFAMSWGFGTMFLSPLLVPVFALAAELVVGFICVTLVMSSIHLTGKIISRGQK